MLQKVANFLDLKIQQKLGVVHGKDEKQQEHSHEKGNVGQGLDTGAQSRQHRDCRNQGNAPDGDTLDGGNLIGIERVADPSEVLETDNGLNGAQSKTCADSSDCHHNGVAVDQISNPTPRVVSKNRVKARAEGHGESKAVSCQTHAHGYNQIGSPSIDGPVGNC